MGWFSDGFRRSIFGHFWLRCCGDVIAEVRIETLLEKLTRYIGCVVGVTWAVWWVVGYTGHVVGITLVMS